MKFGRPLAIIVHYTVQVNLECCKSSVPDIGPNTILKILKKTLSKDVLKVKLQQKNQTYNHYEIWWTTCYHRPLHVQFNLERCKSSVPDMGPNTILKIKNLYQRTS